MQKEVIKEEDKQMMAIYEWIDSIPLSREKKNISRDFSDGLLLAEILKQYYPKQVDLHNYPSASSTKQKMANWSTLSRKVLKKAGIALSQDDINDVIVSKPKAIERILMKVYKKVTQQATLYTSLNLTDSDGEGNSGNHLEEQLKRKEEEWLMLNRRKAEIEAQLNNNHNRKSQLVNRVNHLTRLIQGE